MPRLFAQACKPEQRTAIEGAIRGENVTNLEMALVSRVSCPQLRHRSGVSGTHTAIGAADGGERGRAAELDAEFRREGGGDGDGGDGDRWVDFAVRCCVVGLI